MYVFIDDNDVRELELGLFVNDDNNAVAHIQVRDTCDNIAVDFSTMDAKLLRKFSKIMNAMADFVEATD